MNKPRSEAWVKDQVKKILKSYGRDVWSFMPMGSHFGRNGVPDFIVCAGGKMIGIETKTDHGKVSDLQQMQIDNIKAAGGYAIVVNESNLPQFALFMQRLMERE